MNIADVLKNMIKKTNYLGRYIEGDKAVFPSFFLFCGSGFGAKGVKEAVGEYKGLKGTFEVLGGIDVDPYCVEDFHKITGVPATQMDLMSKEQYIDWNGKEPPSDWKEVQPADLLKATGGVYPEFVFTSPPCKAFSGLMGEKTAQSKKYQALNLLTVRGIFLTLEAFKDNLPSVILFENVPRIKIRGRHLINEIIYLLKSYGYVVSEDEYCCGEIGNLGQKRKRFILIARNPKKITSFIYEPVKYPLKTIGDVIGKLPLPGDIEKAGKMHKIPNCEFKTWVRLALIPPGKDWKSLNNLGYEPRSGAYRISPWDMPGTTVTSATRGVGCSNGISAVADPRLEMVCGYGNKFRVVANDEPSPTITGSQLGSGIPYYADPKGEYFANLYRVCDIDKPSSTITGGCSPSNGGLSVNDKRLPKGKIKGIYKLEKTHDNDENAFDVEGLKYCKSRSGTMGVQDWNQPSKTIIAAGDIHSGAMAVADHRIPSENEKGVFIIIAEDGTWHRPLTTLELAALQGIPTTYDDGSPLVLSGNNDASWREHIGNAVPPPAAQAMASMMLKSMVASAMNEFIISENIWVMPEDSENDTIIKVN